MNIVCMYTYYFSINFVLVVFLFLTILYIYIYISKAFEIDKLICCSLVIEEIYHVNRFLAYLQRKIIQPNNYDLSYILKI